MVGLKTARVIVVDDQEEDALQIVRALWKKHIAALYFRGPQDQLGDDHRLCGVRLAFVDMDIVGGHVDPKSRASAVVNLLKHILSPANGPYFIIAWTKHKELVAIFDDYLFTQEIPRPISIVTIAKADCRNADGKEGYDMTKIDAAVEKQLAMFSPLLFLQAWEELSLAAAAKVTHELSLRASSAENDPTKWREQWRTGMLQIMHTMAIASAGKKNVKDGDGAVSAFLGALNPLHADRLEASTPGLCRAVSASSKEILSPDAKKGCDAQSKAWINTMLHCSFDRLNLFQAGNVYDGKVLKVLSDPGAFCAEYIRGDRTSGQWQKRVEEFKAAAIPILVEINATCDHAQKKVRLARLVPGLLIPKGEIEAEESSRIVKHAGYLFEEIGPIYLDWDEKTKGDYYLVLNALYLLSQEVDAVSKTSAKFRLRAQAFGVVQSWFACHGSRPGMLLLRSAD